MAAVVYNRSTPPLGVPMVDKDGHVSPQWRMYFSQLQTLMNSLQQRWIRRFGGGLTVTGNDITTYAGTENDPLIFLPGSPILILNTPDYLRGTVTACSYDSGTSLLTISFALDDGSVIGSADGLFYGVLTSSVLP